MLNIDLLMRHHQPRKNGISLVTRDVCLGPFLFMFKQVSINFPMIHRFFFQDSNVIHQAENVNKDVAKTLMVINHYLHLNVVTLKFEWIIIIFNKKLALGFCRWINVASIALWINDKPQSSLNLAIISMKSLPSCHLIWSFNTTFTIETNSYITKCIVVFWQWKAQNNVGIEMHEPTCTSYKPHDYSKALQIKISHSTFPSSTLISMLDVVPTFYSHESVWSNDFHCIAS